MTVESNNMQLPVLCLVIGLKILCQFFKQREAKPKPKPKYFPSYA